MAVGAVLSKVTILASVDAVTCTHESALEFLKSRVNATVPAVSHAAITYVAVYFVPDKSS